MSSICCTHAEKQVRESTNERPGKGPAQLNVEVWSTPGVPLYVDRSGRPSHLTGERRQSFRAVAGIRLSGVSKSGLEGLVRRSLELADPSVDQFILKRIRVKTDLTLRNRDTYPQTMNHGKYYACDNHEDGLLVIQPADLQSWSLIMPVLA